MTKYNIIVSGSRSFNNYDFFVEKISDYLINNRSKMNSLEFISGHARGPDMMCETFCKDHRIPCQVFPADWEKYGSGAGFIRNDFMLKYAIRDIPGTEVHPVLIAFWDGKSKGTKHMLKGCMDYGLEIVLHRVDQI